ncbi:uncharacterized protein LOC114942989 [Nylanderia fulva]|uniref:uncharacterized protein LOC114942989 n=1 Tax=Nylanderia fulva TaxID=613905 RepID=UPI0010FB3589|nr:uncharacterized protein LOC114942989 [Nylanderia fulva]
MGKLISLLCLAFLAMTLVVATESSVRSCIPHGKPCTNEDECCHGKVAFVCHPWKHICTGGPKFPFIPSWPIINPANIQLDFEDSLYD